MEIQNLSKADYYKSRNIIVPKIQHRIQPQPAPHSHFNSPIPSLSIQVRQYQQAMLRKEKHEINKMNHEPQSHQKGVEIQDLRKQLANKMDEVTELKSEHQKDQRRIEMLERQVFDVKAQLQKMQHEFENRISYLTVAVENQKQIDYEKIVYLEKELQKTKDYYIFEIKTSKQSYESQIKSYSEAKGTLSSVEEELVKGLHREIERYVSQNQKLRSDLILLERQIDKKTYDLQKQNFELKTQLQNADVKYQLAFKKTYSEIDQKNIEIKYLNEQVTELKERFDTQRKRILSEKEYLEKIHSENQKNLQQNLSVVREEKSRTDQTILEFEIQINEFKNMNFQAQRTFNEQTSKILSLEAEKQQIQMKNKQKIDQIENQHRIHLEEEILSVKRNFEQKITQLEKDLEEKNIQISNKILKIKKVDEEIHEKLKLIKTLEEREKTNRKQIEQWKQKNEKMSSETKSLKKQIEGLKVEKKEILDRLEQEITKQLEKSIEESKQTIMTLKKELSLTKKQSEEKQASLTRQILKKEDQLQEIKYQNKKCIQDTEITKKDYEKQKKERAQETLKLNSQISKLKCEITNLKDLIEDIEKIYLKEKEYSLYLKKQCEVLGQQKKLADSQILNIHQELDHTRKQCNIANDNYNKIKEDCKTKALKKVAEIQSQMDQVTQELENYKKKYLDLKTQHQEYHKMVAKLHQDKDHLVQENNRLQQNHSKKQVYEHNLIQERKKITDKITEDFKLKITRLQEKIQENNKSLKDYRQNNNELLTTIQKYELEIKELMVKIQEKDAEISHFEDQTKSARSSNEKMDKQINELNSKFFASQTERKKQFVINENLTKRINEWIKRMSDLEQLNDEEIEPTQFVESRLKNVTVKIEKLNMDHQYQKLQKQGIQKSFQRYKQEAQIQVKELRAKIQQHQYTIGQMELIMNAQNAQNIRNLNFIRDQLKNEMQAKKRYTDDLKKRLETKETELKQNARKICELERYNAQLLEEKTLELKEKDKQIAQFGRKFDELQEQFSKKEEALEQNQLQFQEIQKKIHTANMDMVRFTAEKQIQIQTLQENLSCISTRFEEKFKKEKQAQKAHELQLSVLKQSLNHEKEVNKNLHKKYQDLKQNQQNTLKQKEKTWKSLISSMKLEYEKNIASLNIQINIHKEEIENSRLKYEKEIKNLTQTLEKEKKQTEQNHGVLKKESDEKDKKIIQLQDTCNRAQRVIIILLKYKKRWDFIHGEVTKHEQIDYLEEDIIEESLNASRSMISEQIESNLRSFQIIPEQKPYERILENALENTEKKENIFLYQNQTIKTTKLTRVVNEVHEQERMEVKMKETQAVEVREFEIQEKVEKKEEAMKNNEKQ